MGRGFRKGVGGGGGQKKIENYDVTLKTNATQWSKSAYIDRGGEYWSWSFSVEQNLIRLMSSNNHSDYNVHAAANSPAISTTGYKYLYLQATVSKAASRSSGAVYVTKTDGTIIYTVPTDGAIHQYSLDSINEPIQIRLSLTGNYSSTSVNVTKCLLVSADMIKRYEFSTPNNPGTNVLNLKIYENDVLKKSEAITLGTWDITAWDDGYFHVVPSVKIDPNHVSWYVYTSGQYIVNNVNRSPNTRLSSGTDLIMGYNGHQTFIVI